MNQAAALVGLENGADICTLLAAGGRLTSASHHETHAICTQAKVQCICEAKRSEATAWLGEVSSTAGQSRRDEWGAEGARTLTAVARVARE